MVGNSTDLMELYEQTKTGCDHNCKNCGMWMPVENQCYHNLEQKWVEWNRAEHIRFGEILRGIESVSK